MINWRNIRLVQFPNGNYAVRKGRIRHKYYDFKGGGCYEWRSKNNTFFFDCYIPDYTSANDLYDKLLRRDEVIK